MNYALAYASIGFYQISKIFVIPVTLLLEWMFGLGRQEITLTLGGSLALVVLGMFLVVEDEKSTNMVGVMWVALGVTATAVAQVFFAPLKNELKLNAIQLLFHTSPIMTAGCYAFMPLVEDMDALYDIKITTSLVITVLLSCFVAVAFNFNNYVLLSEISPLTYTVSRTDNQMQSVSLTTFQYHLLTCPEPRQYNRVQAKPSFPCLSPSSSI
jgi:solute carrier family 35 protein E3